MIRNALILIGVFVLGTTALMGLLVATSPRLPAGAVPPRPEAKKVDQSSFHVSPGNRYDVYCSFRSGEPSVYRGCMFLGFTDRGLEIGEPAASSEGSGGSSYLSLSSSSDGYGVDHFKHWLVLQLNDGRKAFFPPSAVLYFEEAQPLPVVVREGTATPGVATPGK